VKASELIKRLEKFIETYGDYDVYSSNLVKIKKVKYIVNPIIKIKGFLLRED
jgi:hypothetical protein